MHDVIEVSSTSERTRPTSAPPATTESNVTLGGETSDVSLGGSDGEDVLRDVSDSDSVSLGGTDSDSVSLGGDDENGQLPSVGNSAAVRPPSDASDEEDEVSLGGSESDDGSGSLGADGESVRQPNVSDDEDISFGDVSSSSRRTQLNTKDDATTISVRGSARGSPSPPAAPPPQPLLQVTEDEDDEDVSLGGYSDDLNDTSEIPHIRMPSEQRDAHRFSMSEMRDSVPSLEFSMTSGVPSPELGRAAFPDEDLDLYYSDESEDSADVPADARAFIRSSDAPTFQRMLFPSIDISHSRKNPCRSSLSQF